MSQTNSLAMLSQKGIDAVKLKDDIASFAPSEAKGHNIDQTAVDAFITEITDDLVFNQIHDATGRLYGSFVERAVADAHSTWEKKEWEQSQTQFMDSLGHRSQKWRNSVSLATKKKQLAEMGTSDPIDNRERGRFVGNLFVGTGEPVAGTAQIANGPGGGVPPNGAGATGAIAIKGQGQGMYGMPMSNFARKHAEVVRKISLFQQSAQLNQMGIPGIAANAMRPGKEVQDIVSDAIYKGTNTDVDNMTQRNLEEYQDIMQQISEICGENKRVPILPGVFSSICFEKKPLNPNSITAAERNELIQYARVMRRTRLELTMGSKRHLETQMRTYWEDFVVFTIEKGRLSLHPLVQGQGESGRQKLRAYVRLREKSAAMYYGGTISDESFQVRSPRDGGATPVWSYVYHCLRVGDLEGAIMELLICQQAGLQIESDVTVVLELFHKMVQGLNDQTNEPFEVRNIQSQVLTNIEIQELINAIGKCTRLYDDEMNNPNPCMYRIFVLNLLSLSDVDLYIIADDKGGTVAAEVDEIEHFMWGKLWRIQWNGVLKVCCDVNSVISENPDNGELQLYDEILEYGADYFSNSQDNDTFTPYPYAKILLCCQRFGDAVNYLWRNDQTIPAVHLMVVCLHYGLILPFRPLNENPQFTPTIAPSVSAYGNPEPSNIISMYTSIPFMLDYPEQTVDYIMCMNTQWREGLVLLKDQIDSRATFWAELDVDADNRLTKEFIHLFTSLGKQELVQVCGQVDANAFSQAGAGGAPVVNNNMARSKGYIDLHIADANMVDGLLSKAAHHLLNIERDSQGAIFLYNLGGQYADVIEELTNQLGMVILPPHAERDYWMEQARTFYDFYIVKGLGPVIQALQRSNRLNIPQHLKRALVLCDFHDCRCAGRFQDALKVLDAENFLPRKDSDVYLFANPRNIQFQHEAVQKATDDLLLCAMECIRHLYTQRKNTGAAAVSDGIMMQLRERAEALVSYSIAIASMLRPDTPQRLSRAESFLL